MLSYRHGFHAGNHADVLKHLLLVECLEYLLRKDSPVVYIDTHSGGGRYDFGSHMAQKTAEAAKGVLKLDFSTLGAEAEKYSRCLAPYLSQQQYPGSPLLAADILRSNDKLHLFELHSSEIKSLEALFSRDRRAQIHCRNGFSSLKALLPVQKARVLVLMDPPYEIKSDYQAVVQALAEGYKRMPHGVFLLWYPVVQRVWVDELVTNILKHPIKDCWRFELGVAADEEKGMTASGMIAINPPWVLPDMLRTLLPKLQSQLSPEGCYLIEQLRGE